MCTLTYPTGKAVVYKASLKHWFNGAEYQLVYHSITYSGFMDLASLGIVHDKRFVITVLITTDFQIV